MAAARDAAQQRGVVPSPRREQAVHGPFEGGELGVAEDGGLDLSRHHQRLAAALPEVIPALEREGALVLSDDLRTTVYALSAATIDRRLAAARRQQ
ncbi:MAG: hypothetical protein LC769_12420, partial [Chloroflexi bacterium]|nr:hypothetical protein [Chloroflexota bacterium]